MATIREVIQKIKVSTLGAKKFKETLFKNKKRTPHYEMNECLNNYETRPIINSGINQIVTFITGNKITVNSVDDYTKRFYNKWIKQRPQFYNTIKKFITMGEVTGNAYLQPSWIRYNGQMILNNVENVDDPSRIYYNLNYKDEDKDFWIYSVPIEMKMSNTNIKQYMITYIKGSLVIQEVVYGFPMPKYSFMHLAVGWSRYGYYGRSYLASTIDDEEIIHQILKNYAVTSKNNAIGRRLFYLGTPEQPATQKDIDDTTNILRSRKDNESIVLGKKLDFVDLNPTEINDMDNQLEFLRKDETSGLVPNHMTPWSETVTYASSNNAKIPFQLSLENKRQTYITFLNHAILDNIRKGNPRLSEDATFEFGHVSLDGTDEKIAWASQLYEANAITLNQYLAAAGYKPIKNGDVFQADRNYQLQQKYQQTKDYQQQFDEPYVNDDIAQDRGYPIAGKESFNPKTDREYKQWLIEIKKSYPEIETKNWMLYKQNILKGHEIRLIKDADNYRLYHNGIIVNIFDDKEIADLAYKKLVEKVKKEFNQFYDGETPEDKLTEEVFKQVKQMQWKITQELLQQIKNKDRKESFKEGVLSPKILSGLDGLFDKFNRKLKGIVDGAVTKLLGISLDNIHGKVVPVDVKKELSQKASLIKNNIYNQFKTFNKTQSQNIRRILTDGIISGQSTSDISQDLKDSVVDWKKFKPSSNDYKIKRIINTEINGNSNLLKLLKWKKMGFTKVRHNTRIDESTGAKDREFNNRIFKIDYLLKNPEDRVPLHPNCRCFYTLEL